MFILDLAHQSRLGVLSTRVALNYYEQNRGKVPHPSNLSEARKKELDSEIRNHFSELLTTPSLTLESIITHPHWKSPLPDPPELTVENVTRITDNFIQEHKLRTEDSVIGCSKKQLYTRKILRKFIIDD
ncbi:MAG: hypothetical protein ACFE9L_13690 [Candidatus Hodarchaeota archaeon]